MFGSDILNMIDMHMHSTFSDGLLTPKEIIDLSIKKGLKGISLTDHDTVDGLRVGQEYAKIKGCEFYTGIEFSSYFANKEVHILGYNIDYNNEGLIKITKKLKEHRETRAIKIINKLREEGLEITDKDLEVSKLETIGRPHIANILMKKGYVKNKEEAFIKYLGDNCPSYVHKIKLSCEEVISYIKAAGGIAIIAHPYLIKDDEIVKKLLDMDIDGLEVYHSKQPYHVSEKYKLIAKSRNLLISGGSDFHGYKNDYDFIGKFGIEKKELNF